MPVVVTGASGGIGRVLVPLLAERGEVRAVLRSASRAEELRAAGAKVAVIHVADTAVLTTVMDGAHTVIHLAGGIDLPDDAAYMASNFDSTGHVIEAAAAVGAARFLFLSSPRADPGSSNVYLRAKGRAEELVRNSGIEHLILRCTHVFGPGQRWEELMRAAAGRRTAVVVGSGRQRVAPIHAHDVARVLVAADDRRDPVSGTRGLQGPVMMTAAAAVLEMVGGRRRVTHLDPRSRRRAARAFGRPVHEALLDLLAAESIPDAPDVDLSISPRPLGKADGERAG